MTFSLENESESEIYVFHLSHDLNLVYVVEAFITFNLKDHNKYTSPSSSMLLVHIHWFFSINFLYRRGFISL